jgi:integrase
VDHGGGHQRRGDLSSSKSTAAAKRADIKNLAPHDLRRTCARLYHLAGGELEQIQFLLGHASVQTTERHLGCKQKLGQAVNDNLGLEVT